VQDNDADWSHEASHMARVYSEAACTIAATASENSIGGLFFERRSTDPGPFVVDVTSTATKPPLLPAKRYWCDSHLLRAHAVDNAPLNQRAWVKQERHLSTRVIHFSRAQIFWECFEKESSEHYPSGLPQWISSDETVDSVRWKDEFRRPLHTDFSAVRTFGKEQYKTWCGFRFCYTLCKLTKYHDKLVALKGMAHVAGEVVGDRLIAGMWEKMLPQEMCWKAALAYTETNDFEPGRWRAPTWSWASSIHGVAPGNIDAFGPSSARIKVTPEIEARPDGRLISASLRVRCKLLAVNLQNWNTHDGDIEDCQQCHDVPRLGPYRRYRGSRITLQSSRLELFTHNMDARFPNLLVCMDIDHREDLVSEAECQTQNVHLLLVQNTHGGAIDSEPTSFTLSKSDVSDCTNQVKQGRPITEEARKDSGDDKESGGKTKEASSFWNKQFKKGLIAALILVPQDEQQTTFARIGYVEIANRDNASVVERVTELWEAAQETTITLV
jgi:hypothetical protein